MNTKAIVLICLGGFFLRLGYILFFNAELKFPDEHRFWGEAMSILNDHTLQLNGKYANDMPATALFVALAAALTGESLVGAKIAMAIVSTFTIYLIAKLTFLIGRDTRAALISAGIASIYPFFIFYSSLLLSETIFIFFFVLFVYTIIDHDSSIGGRSGVTAGLTHLTKPTLFYCFPVIWFWQYVVLGVRGKTIWISVLVFSLIVFSWGLRNYHVFGEFVFTTSGSGQVLWEGNNPWNKTGGVSGTFQNPDAYLQSLPEGLDELPQDRWKKSKAIDHIVDNPILFASLGVKKFFRFWSLWPNSKEYSSLRYKLMSLLSFGVVLSGTLVGVFWLREHNRVLSLLYLLIIYFTAIHMVTIGSIRYRLPVEPFLIVITSLVLAKVIRRIPRAKEQKGRNPSEYGSGPKVNLPQ